MTTWDDLLPLIEAYQTLFDDDPPDLINVWDFNTLESALLKALRTGKALPELPRKNGIQPYT